MHPVLSPSDPACRAGSSLALSCRGFLPLLALLLIPKGLFPSPSQDPSLPHAEEFAAVAYAELPLESPYQYQDALREGPVHQPRRLARVRERPGEMEIASRGWRILYPRDAGPVLSQAAADFQDYLQVSMEVAARLEPRDSLADWQAQRRAIVAGTRSQLPECAARLEQSKDYRIVTSPEQVVVCGFDEAGAMHGLYHLEARLNLRQAPRLPARLDTVRRSKYRTRMVLNYLGWMEWSDPYLSQVAHAGFDAVYASVYANPNGAEGTAHYTLIRRQDPEAMKDLLRRAARYGIKVYTPLLYRYTGQEDNEAGLRRLVREIVTEFPEIQGYVLLTEGFFYDTWFGAGGHGAQDLREWARHWTRAVAIVTDECHRINPEIEILPWEYNIDFRPQQAELKRYVVSLLPRETIPLLTWENGKAFEVEGFRGYVRDYSISQIGPAEVTQAQMAEARRRGMRVYTKADTFSSWQFGTTPYLPVPYQWFKRYQALEEYGVDGTLETWSYGYKPNFVAELRSWYCWTEAPPLDELLRQVAVREFGPGSEEKVLPAWKRFSEALPLLPDTGPSMGTNFAVGNPLFFQEPPPRTMTLRHSWWDQEKWTSHLAARIHPYWPYTRASFSFFPDFSHRVNMAERYARSRSGIDRIEPAERLQDVSFLPLFLRRLKETAERLEQGLKLYRQAALQAPPPRRLSALREVLLVEQMQRMLQSERAILEFEDLRFTLEHSREPEQKRALLERMVRILEEEQKRTRASLEAARRDSRLGFEMEMDHVYGPHVLEEKLKVLEQTLREEIPSYRARHGL